jgi:hypothetical protein
MRPLILPALLLLLQACTNTNQQKEPFKSLLAGCDSIDIVFYDGGDSMHYNTKDSLGLVRLSETITGKSEMVSDTCRLNGELRYFKQAQLVFTSQFAEDSSIKNCNYVTYRYNGAVYKHRPTERVKKLLSGMVAMNLQDVMKRDSLRRADTMITDTSAAGSVR